MEEPDLTQSSLFTAQQCPHRSHTILHLTSAALLSMLLANGGTPMTLHTSPHYVYLRLTSAALLSRLLASGGAPAEAAIKLGAFVALIELMDRDMYPYYRQVSPSYNFTLPHTTDRSVRIHACVCGLKGGHFSQAQRSMKTPLLRRTDLWNGCDIMTSKVMHLPCPHSPHLPPRHAVISSPIPNKERPRRQRRCGLGVGGHRVFARPSGPRRAGE